MKIAVLLIATGGERYLKFVKPLTASIKKFFPPSDIIVFTDNSAYFFDDRNVTTMIPQPNLGWPRATLMRYHAIGRKRDLLSQYDQLFYMDIDMLVCSPVGSEIFSTDLTAVIHPGFPTSFERNPQSTAYVAGDPPYYQGCFIGGSTSAFLKMCDKLAKNIDIDDSRNIVAIWHDESHLNRYLIDNPPSTVLSPAYCYPAAHYLVHPETWMKGTLSTFVPKIRHMEKTDQGKWKHA